MKTGKGRFRLARLARQPLAWAIGIIGVFLIVLDVIFWVRLMQDAYGFYGIARSTQGTVQDSSTQIVACGDGCDPEVCQTTVKFIPPGQSKTFTTTDYLCEPFTKGTHVEVLYDPNNPSRAKTPREAAADAVTATFSIIAIPAFVFFAFCCAALVVYGIYRLGVALRRFWA